MQQLHQRFGCSLAAMYPEKVRQGPAGSHQERRGRKARHLQDRVRRADETLYLQRRAEAATEFAIRATHRPVVGAHYAMAHGLPRPPSPGGRKFGQTPRGLKS